MKIVVIVRLYQARPYLSTFGVCRALLDTNAGADLDNGMITHKPALPVVELHEPLFASEQGGSVAVALVSNARAVYRVAAGFRRAFTLTGRRIAYQRYETLIGAFKMTAVLRGAHGPAAASYGTGCEQEC